MSAPAEQGTKGKLSGKASAGNPQVWWPPHRPRVVPAVSVDVVRQQSDTKKLRVCMPLNFAKFSACTWWASPERKTVLNLSKGPRLQFWAPSVRGGPPGAIRKLGEKVWPGYAARRVFFSEDSTLASTFF